MTTADELTTLLHEARAKADQRVPALRLLVYGRPANEGEPCPECGLFGDWFIDCKHPGCVKGRVGSQPAIEGLLVKCATCVGTGDWGPIYDCQQCDICHGTGYVLLPRLREAIEAGEWGMAIGAIEDRLRAAGARIWWENRNEAHGVGCIIKWKPGPRDDNLPSIHVRNASMPSAYAALVDALRRWLDLA